MLTLGQPQALKSRIALNSAKLIQEQRVTNLHVKEIAQHLEQQNDLLQMIRPSQEVQACAQERQAQAMEGTQAALSVPIQVLRPMIKDFRRYLQSNMPNSATASEPGQVAYERAARQHHPMRAGGRPAFCCEWMTPLEVL